MPDATFTAPDLTTFARLDELGLEVTGQRLEPKSVATAWHKYGCSRDGCRPSRSPDPELVAKVDDVVGRYLDPPQHATVLCVDEKSQFQAPDRTAPRLPMHLGAPERCTHDYKRHGTTTLFAALEIATGKGTAACKPHHQEFLACLKQIVRANPDRELHRVMDNYSTTGRPRSATGSSATSASTPTSHPPRPPG